MSYKPYFFNQRTASGAGCRGAGLKKGRYGFLCFGTLFQILHQDLYQYYGH